MKHRPIKRQYHTVCEMCGRALGFTGGAWVNIDNGSVICLGEYEGTAE